VGVCGTDQELLAGTMPYLQEGVAEFPLRPGHEIAGLVLESDPDGPAPGARVVIDPVIGCGSCEACARQLATRCASRREIGVRLGAPGGAAEVVAVPTANLHVVPDAVPLRHAVLAEPGVTALNGVRRLGAVQGARALVIGPGTLGLVAAQLLAAEGGEVAIHDPAGTRSALAGELGIAAVRNLDADAFDVVVEAMGAPESIHLALRSVAPGGRIAVLGVQPDRLDGVDVNALVFKDAQMFGVLNGPGLFDEMLAYIASGAVRPSALLETVVPIAAAAKAFAAMSQRGRARPKILLAVSGADPLHADETDDE
jgi:threonine dehydrogenase-like Zn-dependent dehydrogenase